MCVVSILCGAKSKVLLYVCIMCIALSRHQHHLAGGQEIGLLQEAFGCVKDLAVMFEKVRTMLILFLFLFFLLFRPRSIHCIAYYTSSLSPSHNVDP